MAKLVSEWYGKYYTAPVGSWPCQFCLFVTVLCIFLSALLTFSSLSFWINAEMNYLTADVGYMGKYALILNDNIGDQWFFSNIEKLQSLNTLQGAYSYGSSTIINTKNLTIFIKTSLTNTDRYVTSGTFMPVLKFNITDYVNFYTTDFLTLNFESNSGIDNGLVNGDLYMQFKNPIDYYSIYGNCYEYSALEATSLKIAGVFPYMDLYQAKSMRNQTQRSNYYVDSTYSNTNQLTLNVSLSQPNGYRIQVIPGIFQSLKRAWGNFIYILIPFALISQYLMIFAFKKGVFKVKTLTDFPAKFRPLIKKYAW